LKPGYPPPVSLEIDHVTKRFGTTTALDGLTFDVGRGEVFGFLGANGAGKTTTMRICLGIVVADDGAIRWDGRPVGEVPRRTWGYLPEERGLYPRMNVLDQLVYFGSLYGMDPTRARRDALGWLDRFRIPEYAVRRAEELSKGNQQKVQFIAAVLHDPEVLLMDEPFTGLDPVNLILLREAFAELRDRGRTVIFSTHQMETAEAMCESVAIVDHGRLVACGRVRDLKRASGRRTLRIGLGGVGGDDGAAPGWLGSLPGVGAILPNASGFDLELQPSADPAAILAAVLAQGASVSRFEVVEPSLETLFIEYVGRAADDDPTLARGAPGRALSTGTAG
jgi:ABC-2 type transport system ATP-binding protein